MSQPHVTDKITYIGSMIGTALGWTLNEWLSVLSFVLLLTFYAASIYYKARDDARAQEVHERSMESHNEQ